MNLLICKEEWRIGNSNRFRIVDPIKVKHISEILHKRVGDRLKAGIINESLGQLLIEESNSKEILGTYKTILKPKPRFPEVQILLAVNRPPTVRKILELAGTWGIDGIRFFLSKNSRKEYLTSPVWKPEEIEKELIEGMEQGKNIFLPKVELDFKNSLETILSEMETKQNVHFRFLLDRKGKSISRIIEEYHSKNTEYSHIRMFVAIGPESGFVKKEVDFWKGNHFESVSVSDKILRTETAVAFLLSRLEEESLFKK
ncbi:16S rRNA (uracil(1498)-N(3))-methyltransferase [Leptospira stimsonii]|uniref:Ribosomal RNA small subunit methyltransferase E n=1 Tax=Leptospira stimsonii TaxID=2202203 RepID=A0A4R9L310_9LEPT|nr:16S rRNA (uracil(1498)-N(3))-methyltransferase [Leptospira stimsonii]RHX86553.1 16S rRNA (uracil(1498)-N(3))-methyltransferase [Leptospira stimsonii]TGK14336.1 16S rRNA (uracil(1498)-N(3))-methyltransferase [Leptospira stimsonii]TGM11699.1 16S rRNA (uracil(1498)-N(3))-methyltransferase [Leptospira stimsonii]